jgi:hypothetical protein
MPREGNKSQVNSEMFFDIGADIDVVQDTNIGTRVYTCSNRCVDNCLSSVTRVEDCRNYCSYALSRLYFARCV